MIRGRALLWWGALVLLFPFVLIQGRQARRSTLRLPPAGGAQSGITGDGLAGLPLRLLVLGESTAAGVGVDAQADALAGQLAEALSRLIACPVRWYAFGENGITAAEAVARLLPRAGRDHFDIAVLVFGVNDTTQVTSLNGWRSAMLQLCRGVNAPHVACTGAPPIQHFSALPWLLRRLFGWRADILDTVLRQVCAGAGASHHPLGLPFSAGFLARDGYHPSAQGYQAWASALADELSVILGEKPLATRAR